MTNTQENVIWITGASSGIGKSMAFEWARLGYKVVLSSRRKELLEKVADEIRHSGGEALVIPCDIMNYVHKIKILATP
jgi:short-subunit dehydrogenase